MGRQSGPARSAHLLSPGLWAAGLVWAVEMESVPVWDLTGVGAVGYSNRVDRDTPAWG